MPEPVSQSQLDPTGLAGLTVVVTRPADQAAPLAALLEACGARVLLMPLIEAVDHASADEIASAVGSLTADDWIVVTSPQAAQRVAHVVATSPARVAAVGATTAASLPRVDMVPAQQSAVGLLAEFPPVSSSGPRVLVAQAVAGEPTLVDGLTTLGWNTSRIDTHFSRAVVPTAQQQLGVLQADVVIFTSGSQARAWVDVFGTTSPAVVATIGPQTARNAETCGLKVDVVAADHTLLGVVRAVQGFVKP
jgi:uroporphyrinogen-III synthase